MCFSSNILNVHAHTHAHTHTHTHTHTIRYTDIDIYFKHILIEFSVCVEVKSIRFNMHIQSKLL